jgi:hypothetical protein
MKELGEQWIEELDGKKHMYKADEAINKGHVCNGCVFNNGTCDYQGDECPVPKGCYIKDLGIINENGCLPSPWGGYPKIVRVGREDFCTYKVRFYLKHGRVYGFTLIEVTGNTRQEAIDAWNRRA